MEELKFIEEDVSVSGSPSGLIMFSVDGKPRLVLAKESGIKLKEWLNELYQS